MRPQENSPGRQAASLFPIHSGRLLCPQGQQSSAGGRCSQSLLVPVLGSTLRLPTILRLLRNFNRSPLSAGRLKRCAHPPRKDYLDRVRTFKSPQKGTLGPSWLFLSGRTLHFPPADCQQSVTGGFF